MKYIAAGYGDILIARIQLVARKQFRDRRVGFFRIASSSRGTVFLRRLSIWHTEQKLGSYNALPVVRKVKEKISVVGNEKFVFN